MVSRLSFHSLYACLVNADLKNLGLGVSSLGVRVSGAKGLGDKFRVSA